MCRPATTAKKKLLGGLREESESREWGRGRGRKIPRKILVGPGTNYGREEPFQCNVT